MKKGIHFLKKHFIATLVILLWIKTVAISFISFQLPIHSWVDIVLIVISLLGIIMIILGFGFLFKKQVPPVTMLIIYLLMIGLVYANLLYYRFYIDFVTVSVFLQLHNVGGLGPSTAELVSPFDLLLFLDLIILGLVVIRIKKTKQKQPVPNKKKYTIISMTLVVLTFVLALTKNPYLLETGYNRKELVQSLGLYNYQIVNMIDGLKAPIMKVLADETDVEEITSNVGRKPTRAHEEFGIAKGKNLVLISLESTQNFVINQKINGEEITPFLNDFIKNSYYFTNIYDQAAQGKTSDAEFMINTGLYPLPSGSVFVRRSTNEFYSLPKILANKRNYTAVSFHGNDATFWNREEMYETLGYKRFFSKKDYHVTDENSVNYGIKDIPFFEQSMNKLKTLPEPYMANFLTLTNHFPFLLDEEDQTIRPADTSVEVVNRYVTTVNYEDAALRRFFELVKEKGLYEDSIFVIYGDHYGISQKYEKGVYELLERQDTPLNHLQLQRLPVIIHVPGEQGKIVNTVGGTIDIYATILELMGIRDDQFINFSQNLFTKDDKDPVIFRNGSIVTIDYAYIGGSCYDKKSGETVDTTKCEKYLKKARKELQTSDELILGDLFRFIPY